MKICGLVHRRRRGRPACRRAGIWLRLNYLPSQIISLATASRYILLNCICSPPTGRQAAFKSSTQMKLFIRSLTKQHNAKSVVILRRGRDLNSRGTFIPARFRVVCLRPLSHPSRCQLDIINFLNASPPLKLFI